MNADRLLAHYERIADVSDAVPRLRRFVLDLAVRGKLVDQNPNDEPAAALLKLIAKEKARLVKAGESRREKSLPEIESDDVPYEIPYGWAWTRIREITSNRGQTVPDCDLTYIDVTAINKKVGCIEGAKVISASEAPSRARKIVHKGDVLYSCVRPYLLNVAIVEREISPVPIASTAFAVLNGFELVLPRYQWIVLRSPGMVTSVEEKMRGQAYPAINGSDFALLLFPLPPLAEQHRIVAKFDELMALCDRLEVARTAREATRDRLSASSLVRLNAPDPDTFQDDARFALGALPALTTRPDQITPLRQTILNLAVRGKLVEQDWKDDCGNQGQLRSDAVAETFDAQAFEGRAAISNLPINWAIEPLSRLASHIVDCLHMTPKWTDDGVLCIKTNQVRAGQLDLISPYFVSENTYKVRVSRLEPRQNDVLYIREGGILGLACLVPSNTRLCLGQRLMHIRTNNAVAPQFLELCLNSPWITEFAVEKTTGGAAPRVNMSIVRSYPIPLPPLAEQHRIVAKVDKLMALCDRLEASLVTGDDTRCRLLGALLTEVLECGESHASEQAERVAAHG